MAKAALHAAGRDPGRATRPPAGRRDGRPGGRAAHRPRDAGGIDTVSHPHPELGAPPPLAGRRPAHRRPRRSRRDRPQHDGLRVRRPAARRRLRRAVPRGPPARRRPDPARLRLHPGPPRRRRRPSCSPTATRTTSARCPTCCARSADIPLVGSRLTLALIEAKLQEHRIKPYTLEVARGRPRAARAVRLRVLRRQPLDPGRARGRDPHAGRPGPAHRRLQDGPAAAGRAAHRPARASRGSARRASTCSWSTRPTPRCPASPRPSATSAR